MSIDDFFLPRTHDRDKKAFMDHEVNCVLWLAGLKSVSVVRKEFNLCFNTIYNLFFSQSQPNC